MSCDYFLASEVVVDCCFYLSENGNLKGILFIIEHIKTCKWQENAAARRPVYQFN
jgi:hypothetical protein